MEKPVGMTTEDVKEIVRAAVQEAKRPDPEKAAAELAEKARKEQARRDMLEVARLEEEGRRQRQASCPHRKENGRWATGGQLVGDGRVAVILCTHCQKTIEVQATAQMREPAFNFNGFPMPA